MRLGCHSAQMRYGSLEYRDIPLSEVTVQGLDVRGLAATGDHSNQVPLRVGIRMIPYTAGHLVFQK